MSEKQITLPLTGQYYQRCKFYLPSYNLYSPNYNNSSRKGCIVLPLFQGWRGLQPEYHINSAFWVYHSLLVNSNAIDMRIPIIFYIEGHVFQDLHVRQMFEQSRIPIDRVWTFKKVETDNFYQYYLGTKMCPLWDSRFDKFDNVLIWDTDLFCATTKEKMDLGRMFKREMPTQPAAIHVLPDNPKPFRFKETHDMEGEMANYLADTITEDLTGKAIRECYTIGGCLHSFCPKEINSDYVEFYKKALPLIGDDELIVSLWSIANDEPVEALDKHIYPIAYEFDHSDHWAEEGTPFLSHIWTESLRHGRDIQQWKDFIGMNTAVEAPFSHHAPCVVEKYRRDEKYVEPKVAVLNLKRRTDRLDGFTQSIRKTGYNEPFYIISGVDRQGYETYDDLIDDAVREYPQFGDMRGEEWGLLAYQWSYLKCLYWISQQDSHVLLFEDDMTLRCSWQEFIASYNLLPQDTHLALLNYAHQQYRQRHLEHYMGCWHKGAKSNGTSANVISPAFAKELHDIIASHISVSAEMHVAYLNGRMEGLFSAYPVLAGTHSMQGESDVTESHNV